MNKLYVFGDSFSVPFNPETNWHLTHHEYVKWKGYIPKYFADIVAEKLNLELINVTYRNACDNNRILEKFIETMDLIQQGDVVSIGWTGTQRLSFVDTRYNIWHAINAFGMAPGVKVCDIPSEALIDVATARGHKFFEIELRNWAKLVSRSKPFNKIIHWSWENNRADMLDFQTISTETNGVIDDGHWSEKGHQQFAEYFLDLYYGRKNADYF